MTGRVQVIRRISLGLRVFSYVCGFAGMAMLLAARGMSEPGSTVWGQRSIVALTMIFCGFIGCYILAFTANALRKN